MDCKEFDKLAAEYAEGLLDKNIQAEMECHRAECASCDELARVHETLLETLNQAAPVKAPAGLSERILAAVSKEETQIAAEQRTYRRTISTVWSVAACLAGGLIAAWHFIYGAAALKPLESATTAAEHAYFSRWYQFVSSTGKLLSETVKLPGYDSPVPLMYLGVGLVFISTLAWLAYSQRRPALLTV